MTTHARPYQLKRGPWKRKGGPCVECGSESCRTVKSFACWVRCFQRVLKEHNYVRCRDQAQHLRAADIPMLFAPQPHGTEVSFGPIWAIALIKSLRNEAQESGRRITRKQMAETLRTCATNAPPPPGLINRFDELRAYAVLRGWRFQHGMWYRSES